MVNKMNLPNRLARLLAVLICAVSMFTMADDIDFSELEVSKMDVPNTHFPNTDSLFQEIQRTVAEVDFVGMAAAYHVDAVLVNAKSTASISGIMPSWKASGEKLQSEGSQASVAFRFTSRQHDSTSAFDRGIFRYAIKGAGGVEKATFVYFENLAVFRDGRWLTLMERQMDTTDVSTWNSLPVSW